MESFTIALTNVLVTLFYIVPGFLLRKAKMVTEKELPTVSAIMLYGCTPFLILTPFLKMEFSWRFMGQMGLFFLATLVLQGIFMFLLYLIFRKHFTELKYRVMTVGAVIGNVGFFGLPIVSALFPDLPEVVCYSAMYMISMNVVVYSFGVFFLTGDKKYASVKAMIVNPSTLGFAIALPVYIFGLGRFLPDPLKNGIQLLGSMTAPLCMIILGIRLASRPLKEIFMSWHVYPAVLLKLIAFPLFAYAAVYFLPLPAAFKAAVLVLSATPCGSVVLNLAEMHRSDADLAARILLVSTLCCFLTIPVLTLLLKL